MKLLKFFVCMIISVITLFSTLISSVNDHSFTVDTAEKGNTISNVASNVNIWSIEGNPFVNATANKEYNIFEFVEYIQLMQCSGGTEERDLFVDPTDTSTLTDYDFSLLINSLSFNKIDLSSL